MSRKTLFLALALALPAGSALAQGGASTGLSWSFLDIGVQHMSPDEGALDSSTGAALRGSGAINPNWHVFLGWNRSKLKGSDSFTSPAGIPAVVSVDEDLDRFHVGLGYNLPVGQNADLFARVAYESVGSAQFNVAMAGQNLAAKLDRSNGYSVEVGVRNGFTPRFEGGLSVRYLALDEVDVNVAGQTVPVAGLVDDSAVSVVLQGQYKFNNGWGIVGEGDLNSEYQAVFLGARLSY